MKKITESQYELTPHYLKGVFTDPNGLNPEWKGKRKLIEYTKNKGSCLLIEGVHFVVIKEERHE